MRGRPASGKMAPVKFLVKTLVTALAFALVALILPDITIDYAADSGNDASTADKVLTLLVVAVTFGLINTFIKPIIKAIGCALYLLTLGLAALVVNALLFLLTAWIAEDVFDLPFQVTGSWGGFWTALFGSVLVTIATWVINLAVPDKYNAKQ